jgi:hypothetical protein
VSPTSLSFGNQVHGTASSAKKVTFTNGQCRTITIRSTKQSTPLAMLLAAFTLLPLVPEAQHSLSMTLELAARKPWRSAQRERR